MTLAKDKNSAEEITQETFYRAISTEKSFKGDSDSFTWLCAIAKNIFIDDKRRYSRQDDEPSEELPYTDKGLEEKLSDREMSLKIHSILHRLEEPYKEVFQLRVFGELSFAEIGSIFGKTESWARVTYHRARLKIKERMDEYEI
ncbi:MAG: RNA polymerase sigma factor [Saccharofermentans sp.]|nr:RNA polymerase sigma factor [Saccharofermentans sp.]